MDASFYTARAIKSTALLEETRSLLRAWRPGESAAALRQRARAEDLLGKATAGRAGDIVQSAFISRLLTEAQEPAASLRRLLDARGNGPWFAQMCLLFSARADVVLRDAVAEFLPDAHERSLAAVSTAAGAPTSRSSSTPTGASGRCAPRTFATRSTAWPTSGYGSIKAPGASCASPGAGRCGTRCSPASKDRT